MRAGCAGCLGGVVIGGLGVLLLILALGVGGRMLTLSGDDAPATLAADGARAQQKLFRVARRGRRAETVTLSEAEVNALLGRHLLDAGGLRLVGLGTRLVGGDRLELRAQTPLGPVLDEVGLGVLRGVLPERWNARPVELHVGARLTIEEGAPRQLRLAVDDLVVGRQRMPAPALRVLVDPATLGLLRWRLPDHVARVAIEPGQVVIRTAP